MLNHWLQLNSLSLNRKIAFGNKNSLVWVEKTILWRMASIFFFIWNEFAPSLTMILLECIRPQILLYIHTCRNMFHKQ